MSLIEAAADSVQPAAASLESLDPDSWPSWLQYMSTVDDDSNRLVQLRQELGREVQMERYQAAAAVKAQLKELEQKDALASVLNELQVGLTFSTAPMYMYGMSARAQASGAAALALTAAVSDRMVSSGLWLAFATAQLPSRVFKRPAC